MQQTYSNRLEYEVNRLIDEAIAEISATLAAGTVEDIKEYKFRVGVIRGLNQARDIVAEADKIIITGARG